jgi:hypothetical protein
MKLKASHHRGTYHQHSRAVVFAARAHPGTRCWRCHLTFDEYAARYGQRAAAWTAGHVNDGEVGGQLLPEHHRCNSSAGATSGNLGRSRNRTSRLW